MDEVSVFYYINGNGDNVPVTFQQGQNPFKGIAELKEKLLGDYPEVNNGLYIFYRGKSFKV